MKSVVVLMSTYNGEKYLKEQIDSVLNQKNVDVKLLVRDDGSTDNTIKILEEYGNKIKWYKGSNVGPAKSFMDLLYNAPEADYYAFCDQDDVWLDDKLEIGLNKIGQFSKDEPALYYGSPRIVDESLNEIKKIKVGQEMKNFESCFISSSAAGCTEVFNRSLLNIVKSKKPEYVYMHDAWIHKVCLLFDGKVVYDKDVHILYRQHQSNVIGASMSLFSRVKKHINSFFKKDRNRSLTMQSLYFCYGDLVDQRKKRLLELVVDYEKSFRGRIKLFLNNEIKTAYLFRNIMYKISVLFKSY